MNYTQPAPPPRKRHHWVRNTFAAIGGAIVLIIVISALAGGSGGSHVTSGPAETTSSAPADAPAAPAEPAAAPAAAPAAPQTLLSFTGHGSESTPKFSTSGDFTVTWTYRGNVDTSLGSTIPGNFIMTMNTAGQGNDFSFNGANDIQASGTGNQTVSGDDGTHYLTVQSNVNSTWTVKVTTAS